MVLCGVRLGDPGQGACALWGPAGPPPLRSTDGEEGAQQGVWPQGCRGFPWALSGVVPGDSPRDPGGSEQGLAVRALLHARSAWSPSLGTVALASSASGTGLWQQWRTAAECLLFVT